MDLALAQENDVWVAVTDGPIDNGAQGPFRDQLHPLFADKGVKLVIDMAGSKRIGSEGISALVRLVTDANTRGCRVIFAAPAPFVREVFQMTRLDTFFEIVDSRGEALQLLGGESSDGEP